MELKEAQYVLNKFVPGSNLIELKEAKEGLINSTFILSTLSEKYVLQKINQSVFKGYEKALENIIIVKNWLIKSDFPYQFPTPLNDKYLTINNEVFRLQPFVTNSKVLQKISNNAQAYEAAVCLGSFYKHLHNKPTKKLHTTILNFHNGNHRLKEFFQATKNASSDRMSKAKKLIIDIENQLQLIKDFDSINKSLPLRTVHNDTKISNFLFDKKVQKVKALIDLDTLMPGTVLSDIGDMIRTYSNPLGEESVDFKNIAANNETIDATIEGFCSQAILNPNEKKHLRFGGKAITLIQSIRFLTDYLNNDFYYKVNYADHNLDRAKNQWMLYQTIQS